MQAAFRKAQGFTVNELSPHGDAAQPLAAPPGRRRTCVDGFVAGEVPLVAEGGLAAVTLVGLVAVHLQGVPLEGGLLGEPAVALVAEEGSVLWEGREGSHEMDETGTERPAPKRARVWLGEMGRGRQSEFWNKEGGPDVFVVSHAMASPAFSRTQDQRAWLEREEATRATSPSV